jgi:hypothetical protein
MPEPRRAHAFEAKVAAAVVVAVTLSLAAVNLNGRLSALASDPAFVATAASYGVRAAGLRGWGRVVAGDEFSYVGAPDPKVFRDESSPSADGRNAPDPPAGLVFDRNGHQPIQM